MTVSISGTYSGLVTLSGAADDPATITANGLLNAGLYASSLAAVWSITNAGTILGLGATLRSAGTVLNIGDIAGAPTASPGIYLFAGGGVINFGLISGLYGIQARLGAANVQNTGRITGGTVGRFGRGIVLDAGGGVTNESSGVIGGYDGIDGGSVDPVTVENFGSITGNATASGGNGITLNAGGRVANEIFGVIGGYDGIDSELVDTVTVENSGSIAGNATVSGGKGILLGAGGVVTNQSLGVISGYDGIYVLGGAMTVANLGRIAGNTTATHGSGVTFMIGGVLTNAYGGTISGHVGVYSGHSGATIVNDGLIMGYATKYGGRGVSFDDGGNITNQQLGSISGNYAIFGGAGGAVTVVNAGLVAGDMTSRFNRGIVLQDGTVTNTGSIIGFDGLYGRDGGVITVVNAGTIAGNASLGGNGIRLGGGSIDNQQSGSVNGFYGLFGSGTITVSNAGRIDGNQNVTGAAGIIIGTGSVTNQDSGTINGFWGILGELSSDPTVVNSGYIEGNTAASRGVGVYLQDDGSVINDSSGTIIGRTGILAGGAYASIVNSGSILGNATLAGASGVSVAVRGSVTNQSNGTIGGYYGVFGGTIVVNDGLITGNTTAPNGRGVRFTNASLSLTNQSQGTISGYDGILAGSASGVTITNAGTIIGTKDAVIFRSGTASRLIIDPNAVFVGTVTGLNLVNAATLELASAASAGTLSQLGTQFVDFSQVLVDEGASWTLAGSNTLPVGATLSNAGTLTLLDATLTADAVVNNGGIVLDPSTMTVASLDGSGTVTIAAGGTLDVQGTVASGETIVFGGAGAYLHVRAPDSFSGSIVNFAAGETIDLAGVAPATVAYAAGRLSFGTSGGSIALAASPEVPLAGFASADGSDVTVLCFCTDTFILTEGGERPVQDLVAGDRVVTYDGSVRPIVWIGIGKVLATHGRRNAATPVIVRKGALGPDMPHTDLRVTKGHALWFDGLLIPVEFLVNHRSILWDDRAQEVSLYHVELATHDVLLANGAATESYRDDGNRWLFQNARSGWELPAQAPCAPVLTGGPAVDAVWRRLLDRCGQLVVGPLTEEPDLHLLVDGHRLNPTRVSGQAYLFTLRTLPGSVRIVSRAAVPQVLGFARDPRCLGVALRRVSVGWGAELLVTEADDPRFNEGFHDFEPENWCRWTCGDAALPAALLEGWPGPLQITLTLGGVTRYPVGVCGSRAA
ncbi:Hint domain-containing protein [Acidisphaera sp. S103]|uniref:Hint domain-containing protein n=1 Tax=Acidisphaera sp. S103 TaxID=1747223 RepID=UPI00131C24BF|nr:Hint domain-containing protein [Acidisphaera sp. S103]